MSATEYWAHVMVTMNDIKEEDWNRRFDGDRVAPYYSKTYEEMRTEAIESLYVRGIYHERGHA